MDLIYRHVEWSKISFIIFFRCHCVVLSSLFILFELALLWSSFCEVVISEKDTCYFRNKNISFHHINKIYWGQILFVFFFHNQTQIHIVCNFKKVRDSEDRNKVYVHFTFSVLTQKSHWIHYCVVAILRLCYQRSFDHWLKLELHLIIQ